jgi:hypothetical protein
MLFDWLITGQVLPTIAAAAVRGPKYVVTIGKTPVLEGAEWRKLLYSIPTDTVCDLRNRALIATVTYSFARIGAAVKMKWKISGRRAPAGTCTSTKKVARSTRCHAISPGRNAACLHRGGWHRRGPQGLVVSKQPRTQRHRPIRAA